MALLIAQFAGYIGALPLATSGTIAAVAFFGGYAAQFIGHAVEKSMPVLIKHPVQANLAAPFFTVVEMFKILGLRDSLFHEVQAQIEQRPGPGSLMPGQSLQRLLGKGFSIAACVGLVIGLGILRTPGEIATTVNDPVPYMALWIGCGVFVIISLLVVAELIAMTPRSGGIYALVAHAYGPLPGLPDRLD